MMIFTLKKHYIGKKILSFIKFIGFELTFCVVNSIRYVNFNDSLVLCTVLLLFTHVNLVRYTLRPCAVFNFWF